MNTQDSAGTYVGQVERDLDGVMWAVLYYGEAKDGVQTVVAREQVRSLRQGRRRVTDLVLAAADNYPHGPLSSAAVPRPASIAAQPTSPEGRVMGTHQSV